MEKKTTQRIIGMLVVVSLAVIILPLLFGKNDLTIEAATIKPPMDSQTVLAENTTQPNAQDPNKDLEISPNMAATLNSDDAINTSVPPIDSPSASNNSTSPAPAVTSKAPSNNNAATANADTTPPAADPNKVGDQAMADQTVNPIASEMEVPKADIQSDVVAPVKPAVKSNRAKARTLMHIEKKQTARIVNAAAWVIQMGSFKDKSNATRLVDKLRSAGFKAFSHEFKSAKTGNVSTRVYVGPESKQASAVKLSNKVEQQLSLRGYVISYNLLEI